MKVSKPDMYRIQGCKYVLQSMQTVDVSCFDNDPDVLNILDGVVNLHTGEIKPHNPSQHFTYCVPAGIGTEEDAEEWVKFLKGAVGDDQEMLEYLQMAVGYSITGHTSEEKLFYLFGPTRSGKGTFSETILALMPRPLGAEVDFNTFTAKREGSDQNFDLAPLKPARIVFASESNRYQTLNPGKIKQLTGGNYIHAALKHRDMFIYKPQYAIWLVSNHPVNGDAEDDALWARVHVIKFPHSHLGAEDITLKARMRSPEVLGGVLYWAIKGAMKWYQEGRFPTPEAVKVEVEKHRAELDTVQHWIEECAERDPGEWESNELLTHSYRGWCEANGVLPKQGRAFADSLKLKGFTQARKTHEGKQVRAYEGIRLVA